MEKFEEWKKAQQWEKSWHDNCVNSYNEETKQLVYAKYMGLKMTHNAKTPYVFDMQDKSVLDLGGGPYSLLLKCENFSKAVVVDPGDYPEWVIARYSSANIVYWKILAEDIECDCELFDEVWLYNVLQHTYNPEQIVKNALSRGRIVRIFEWINTGISEGHLHDLEKDMLDTWLGGYGKTKYLNGEGGCKGDAYYGIFPGSNNDK